MLQLLWIPATVAVVGATRRASRLLLEASKAWKNRSAITSAPESEHFVMVLAFTPEQVFHITQAVPGVLEQASNVANTLRAAGALREQGIR